MREQLLRGLGGACEDEHAAVVLEQRLRRGRERPLQPKRADQRVDPAPQRERDGGGLQARECKALVAQPILLVAWVTPSEPEPRAQLVHHRRRVVEVAIARDIEVEDVTCRDLVQVAAAAAAEHAAGGRELVVGQAAGCVLESARLPLREIVGRERRLVPSVGGDERADAPARDVDRRLEVEVDPGCRRRDRHRFHERTEREEEIAPRGVAGGQLTRLIEGKRDPVGRVLEQPGLRVVRRRRAEELRLESLKRTEVGHATSRL